MQQYCHTGSRLARFGSVAGRGNAWRRGSAVSDVEEAPALLESQYFYLRVGQPKNIKPTYWDIRVDRIDGMRANFSVLYRDELIHEKKAGS
jgi:hypothetical protein